MKILTVANQKGGVGKTTTAVNLAVSLSALDHRVLLLDLDPQCNATSSLSALLPDQPRRDIYAVITDYFQNPATPVSFSLTPTTLEPLFLLPGSADLAALEIELSEHPDSRVFLRKILRSPLPPSLSPPRPPSSPTADPPLDFDYLILDTPPGIGLITVNALVAADTVLVPVQTEYLALEGLSQLLRTLILLQKNFQTTLDSVSILLTMFDSRLRLSRAVRDEITSTLPNFHTSFSTAVCHTIIPRNIRLAEAPSHGKPILLFDPSSTGAEAYLDLAREVLNAESRQKISTRSRSPITPFQPAAAD
ncbi:MAG: ParA family protein [Candidatus Hydrogenedentota bacterium]|nr:MAG: ParA family protein [Candidatus Hydrogenedentota bacterium]